jgi:hypothetical protein
MFRIPIFFLIILFCSCSKDYLFKRDEKKLSQELKNIKITDQFVRNHIDYLNYRFGIRDFNTIADSLDEINKYETIKDFNFSKIPSIDFQMDKWSTQKVKQYEESKQESEEVKLYVDETNKNKIFQIVKKYGYPSFHKRSWNDTINNRVGITYVLTHYNYQTKEEKKFLKLIISEYFKGRVEESEMKHFMWHIDGRNGGYPYEYVIDKNYLKKLLNE